MIASARAAAASVRFPGEDGGRSLAEMAQRDLNAALQLLADRAQYITGATGAAIALRRHGMADMLCRASCGSNAPELGALLSTEFGLSGESVRTKRALRCDDAERDARVNREVCRQLGIASVIVMPVVNDDEVLGVFELFSPKAHAFGERDLTAVQRLSGMVETAVRMAQATERLPEQLKEETAQAADSSSEEQILDIEVFDIPAIGTQPAAAEEPAEIIEKKPASLPPAIELAQAAVARPTPTAAPVVPEPEALPKKKLFWSAAQDGADIAKPDENELSQVPPGLRGLKKCEACGFPVSATRVLCVECEEKKWRGQLRKPQPVAATKTSVKAAISKPEPQAFAAAAVSAAGPVKAVPKQGSISPSAIGSVPAEVVRPEAPRKELAAPQPSMQNFATSITEAALPAKAETPDLVFSAALPPRQSWLAAHKYMVGVLLALAFLIATVFLTR
ncbi:MAG TPA: GAF domain-containing protein [Candidatus Sulfotelmatobacter sp.]|nr:GAF domain-containing protein [Candidatus Sulfotelmatobacter sp.]